MIFGFFHNEISTLIISLVLVSGGIGLYRATSDESMLNQSFVIQFSFSIIATGKLSFVLGIVAIMNSPWALTLALLFVSIATYYIYKVSVDRFLSSFAVLISVLVNIFLLEVNSVLKEMIFYSFLLFQLIVVAIFMIHGKMERSHSPLSYAFVFSLCTSMLVLATNQNIEYFLIHFDNIVITRQFFVNIMLIIALIALFIWSAGGDIKSLKTEPLIIASIGVIFLGIVSAPSVLFSIALLVLGHAKGEKLLISMGALLMPAFVFLYYYNLDILLLEKASILIGNGFVLLLGAFYIKYRSWDKIGV